MGLSADDRSEIMQLAGRYAHAIDMSTSPLVPDDKADDAAGRWAECFTVDGAFQSDLQGRFAGREALLRFARVARGGTKAAGSIPRHWTNHWVIEGDGDRATATSYLMIVDAATGATVGSGLYRDRLERTRDGWRFAERIWDIETRFEPETAAMIRATSPLAQQEGAARGGPSPSSLIDPARCSDAGRRRFLVRPAYAEQRIEGEAQVGTFAERTAVGHLQGSARGLAPVVAQPAARAHLDVVEVDADRTRPDGRLH